MSSTGNPPRRGRGRPKKDTPDGRPAALLPAATATPQDLIDQARAEVTGPTEPPPGDPPPPTAPRPAISGPADEPASNRTVTALAGELESVRRRVDALTGEVSWLRALANRANSAVTKIADAVGLLAKATPGNADQPEEEEDKPEPSWLTMENTDEGTEEIRDLADWLLNVYVRYPGGRLGDCWAWHPDVVTELIALKQFWTMAYLDRASPTAVMEFHDRHRPNTAERVSTVLRPCNLGRHVGSGDRVYTPGVVSGTDLLDEIARWWTTTHGSTSAPPPTPDMLATADAIARARDQVGL